VKGQLPKAYLRIDPNLDQTHPDPGAMVCLLCAAARQPVRGRFKSRELLERVLGADLAAKLVAWGDVKEAEDGSWHVDGWGIWQEGDLTVSERMRRYRSRVRNNGVTPTVTEPSPNSLPPSETVRQQGSKTGTDIPPGGPPPTGDAPRKRPARKASWSTEACDDWNARYGAGSAPGSEIGANLKPLIGKHGWDVVRRAWRRYLWESTHPTPSASDFRKHFADWLPKGRGAARARPRAVDPPPPEPEPPAGSEPPPIDPEAERVWQAALEQLDVPPHVHATWIRPTWPSQCDPEALTVWCPNEAVVSHIRGSYGERLAELLGPRRLKLIHGGVGGGA